MFNWKALILGPKLEHKKLGMIRKIKNKNCSDPPIEFSISVPNLSELGLSPSKPVVERSVSENEAERQNYRKLQLKMERRIKNREKLLAMKRFSGFLKRPEILGKVGYFLSLEGN